MLTDVDFEALRLRKESDELRAFLEGRIERRTQGVYETDDPNIVSLFYKEIIQNEYPGMSDYRAYYSETGKLDFPGYVADYGVADSYEQVLDKYPHLAASDRKYLLRVITLRKEDEEPGGWRWHKWGAYIGVQEPQTEYLYDEPVIDQVVLWHVYEVK